jgi:phosphate butyryltransferase
MRMEDLIERAKQLTSSTIAVACAHELHVLQAIELTAELHVKKVYLVGDAIVIDRLIKEHNLTLPSYEIINAVDDVDASEQACLLVKNGLAACIFKGKVDTSVVLKSVLKHLRGVGRLTHLTMFEVDYYHKLIAASDCAMNIAPDAKVFRSIIVNALTVLESVGIKQPKVALLAAKEKVDKNMPITEVYQQVIAECEDLHAVIDGPLAFDNAISKESCQIKGITSPVGGDADLLVMPDIEAGNIFYKTLTYWLNAKSASVLIGALCPIIITSRSDSVETKYNSIALSLLIGDCR